MKTKLGALSVCLLALVVILSNIALSADKTISFMTVADPYVGAIKQLVPEFEAKTGIKVYIDSVPFPNMHEKAVMELASGSGSYDLISMDAPWTGEFAEANYLLDLTKMVERDKAEIQPQDFLVGAWQGLALWKGRVIGLPLAPYYMYVHYRKDALKKAGIKTPPVTADDFLRVASRINDPKNGFYGVSIAMKRGPSSVNDWSAYYRGFGGKTFVDFPRNYRTAINGPIGVFTTEWFKKLLPYAPPGVLQYENLDRWNAFMHGKAGMVSVYNANSPMFDTAEDSAVKGLVGYCDFPKRTASDKRAAMPFGGFSLVINKSSKNVDAAWAFAKWLTSKEIDRKWVEIPGTPGVPRRISTASDPVLMTKYPYFEIFWEAEKAGFADGVNFRARVPEWIQIEDILGLEINLAVSGEKSVKKALDEAAAKINALMKKAGYPVK